MTEPRYVWAIFMNGESAENRLMWLAGTKARAKRLVAHDIGIDRITRKYIALGETEYQMTVLFDPENEHEGIYSIVRWKLD
jgi:hypothetical protein